MMTLALRKRATARARIRPHEHHAGDDAVLFRVTDAPLLDALGFLRST